MIVIDYIEKGKEFNNVLLIIISIFLISVFVTLIDRILIEYYTPKTKERLSSILQHSLFEVSEKIGIENYDNPDYYSKFYNAIYNSEEKLFETFNNLVNIIANMTSVVLLGSLYLTLSPLALVVIIITHLLSIVNNSIVGKFEYSIDLKIRDSEREYSYINKIFYLPEYVKEMKMHGNKDLLFNKADKSFSNIISIRRGNYRKGMLHRYLVPFLLDFVIGNLLYNGLLLYQVISLTTLSIGGFSALFFASGAINGNLGGLRYTIMQFSKLANYISDIRDFLHLDNGNQTGTIAGNNSKENIEVKNIEYTYARNFQPTLKDITLDLPFGKKIAIVGTNGAGKTTFIKLLLRLYPIQQGNITLGDEDINSFDLDSYREMFGTVFQEFNIYALPLIENVAMDRLEPTTMIKEQISDALCKTDFKIDDSFQDGIYSRLTKEFDSNDKKLSGGQQQKVAIARVLYGNKNYIVLDEPSSALDPVAEFNFNKTISEYSEQKTIIMISHRLSTTKNADIIYVFDKGSVVERGTHKELMDKNGLYRSMYEVQAKKYI